MRVTSVSYGRTIVIGSDFHKEKAWFGTEVELNETDNLDQVIANMRATADVWEDEERQLYAQRRPRSR